MKLIIDVSKETYDRIRDIDRDYLRRSTVMECVDTIYNGIPLEEELEKIRDEIRNFDLVSTNGNSAENVFILTRDLSASVIEKHISELKGEHKWKNF